MKIIRPIEGTKFGLSPEDKKLMDELKRKLKIRDDNRRKKFEEMLKEELNENNAKI